MRMWDMHDRTTEEQARINRGRSNDGKVSEVEDTSPPDDGDNDLHVHPRSTLVHGDSRQGLSHPRSHRPNCNRDGCDDWCVCSLAGA